MLLLPKRTKTFEDGMTEIINFITNVYDVIIPLVFDDDWTAIPKDLPSLRFSVKLHGDRLDHSFALNTDSEDYPFIEVSLLSLDMRYNNYYRHVVSIEALIHELVHLRLHTPYIKYLYGMFDDEIGKYHEDAIEEIVNIETFRLIKKYNDHIYENLGYDVLKEIEFHSETKMLCYKNKDRGDWINNIIGVVYWNGYGFNVQSVM